MVVQKGALFISTLLFLNEISRASSLCDNTTFLSEQVDTMLAECDRETPPSSKVVVTLSLDVRHATIHGYDSTVHMLGDLKMVWEDKRLTWNASQWDCENPLVTAERLWLPDITLLNAAATSNGDVGLRARLSSTGTVSWITRLDITVPVALKLDDWPSDSQTCMVKFGSRAHSVEEMELELSQTKHAVVFESSSWELISVTSASALTERGLARSRIALWSMTLRRRAPAHVLATAGVLFGTLILLAAAGALPPVSRAPAAICASFISAMWLISALLRLPGAYTYPRAVSLMSVVCICGALTTLAAAIVIRLSARTTPAPEWLRAALLRISTRCNLTSQLDEASTAEKNGTWYAASVVVDRVFSTALWITLIVLAIVYFV